MGPRRMQERWRLPHFFITLGLELNDTKVYEHHIRALLRTASYYCEAVVLESRTLPSGTALGLRILRVGRRGAQAMYNQFDSQPLVTSDNGPPE